MEPNEDPRPAEPDLLATDSGNAVVVALDHGIGLGALEGFEDPAATLETVLAGDPDGVLVGPHFARRFADRLGESSARTLVTADFVPFSTVPGQHDGADVQTRVLGSDLLHELDPAGVKTVLGFGREDPATFQHNAAYVAELATELRGTGIPLIVEPVMWGERVPDRFETDATYVESASRIAWELGADIVKLPYTGEQATFEPIIDHLPVPGMVLGGPASGSTEAFLREMAEAIAAGARGLIVGRSIWQPDSTDRILGALNHIVHEGATVETAWNEAELGTDQ